MVGRLCEECLLQLGKVLLHGFFRIALHAYIQRSIYFQAIFIDVIRCAIRFFQVFTGLLHILLHYLAEIGCYAIMVVYTMVVQGCFLCFQRVCSYISQVVVFPHLVYHYITAVFSVFRMAPRVIYRIAFQHSHQHRGFIYGHFIGCLVIKGQRCITDAVYIITKRYSIQVQCYYFVLGQVTFQLHRQHPLFQLQEGEGEQIFCLPREKILSQLLRYRTATTCMS